MAKPQKPKAPARPTPLLPEKFQGNDKSYELRKQKERDAQKAAMAKAANADKNRIDRTKATPGEVQKMNELVQKQQKEREERAKFNAGQAKPVRRKAK